ncbi:MULTISPECIES: ATP-binding protein [unclassified Nocardiopsis]|jgi:signal transduction histidine kinase|uniref:ATP-binding protein n=1 Tax=unclassified Nocardiopsis TaxID=2649073 RepID=UPI000AB0355E|nr:MULTISPECIES: ATP-binding protein [unclassified Nocardiopsis]MBQ1083242.1 sensor histidine kinase [Nocardiopsis sp. B62]
MTDQTPRPDGVPPARSTAPRWLLVLVPALPAWGWALWATRPDGWIPVLAAGGVALALILVLALLLARRDRQVAELRARVDTARTETAALSTELLPRMVEQLRSGDSADTVLHRMPDVADPAISAVLRSVASEVSASERRRSAAMAACATAAGRVQALSTTMLADLRRMQERHGDGDAGADVLGDLMQLDHTTAQTGRVADSIAILTGARSGRRWGRAIPMESVLRGAMGRIGAYQRVRTHSVTNLAVAGFAAEGVIHALAEILDNAAKFSPPTAEVHVHVEEVQAGIAVMVEDGGLVMGEEALRRARAAVRDGLDITTISGTRLGLSVVGRIAQRYGLEVSFRSSSRGGTAVVLLLPQRIVKPLTASVPAQPITVPEPSSRETAAPPADTAPAPRADSGLPLRRRGQSLAAAERNRPAPKEAGPRTPSTGFGAFRSAVRGQETTDSPKET